MKEGTEMEEWSGGWRNGWMHRDRDDGGRGEGRAARKSGGIDGMMDGNRNRFRSPMQLKGQSLEPNVYVNLLENRFPKLISVGPNTDRHTYNYSNKYFQRSILGNWRGVGRGGRVSLNEYVNVRVWI